MVDFVVSGFFSRFAGMLVRELLGLGWLLGFFSLVIF
jgi:hypothetical protein